MTARRDDFWIPGPEDVRDEIHRLKTRGRFNQALKSTLATVIVVAALAVLIAAIFLPVLRVTGPSMEPNFNPGDILVTLKTSKFDRGEVCAFYYNNKLIIKRVIAFGGETVEISEGGAISVNGRKLNEPYLQSRAFGLCDLEFPYEVPVGKIFVLGDNRETSVDSRSHEFGCIGTEEVLGKVFLRVLPLNAIHFYGF